MSVGADPVAAPRGRICRILFVVWCVAYAVSLAIPAPAAAAIQSLVLLLFVLAHGTAAHGGRGMAAFVAIALIVAFGFEATSIRTGFPFGFYTHGDAMGPKIAGVPIPVIAGYPVLGYLAWSLARILVRAGPQVQGTAARFATPIAAAFILTGYDLAYDPIGAAAQGMWTFRHPGGQFGSPLSNYLGWLLTGWTFFQLFALIERGPARSAALVRGFWLLPCLVWGAMVIQFAAMLARAPAGIVVRGGRTFVIADIHEASLITAGLTMLFAAFAAAARLSLPAVSAPAATAAT